MTRVFFVVDVDHDFKGDMSEAAIWLEDCFASGTTFQTKVVAYRSMNDLVFDHNDREGAFKEPPDTDGDTSKWNENGEGSERDNDSYARRANPEEN